MNGHSRPHFFIILFAEDAQHDSTRFLTAQPAGAREWDAPFSAGICVSKRFDLVRAAATTVESIAASWQLCLSAAAVSSTEKAVWLA
ncbi:MAG TPA: hypothetical protein PKY10_04945 [Lentisphaeria bacterium]|nr:hypothetical protein [Lentisphaeria bacterium]